MKKIGFGSLPSPTDTRDFKDKKIDKRRAFSSPLPVKYITDISNLQMRMQFQIGKCIGASVAKNHDFLFKGEGDFSDDFLYLGTKMLIDGDMREGTAIRSALKFAQKYGVCKQSTFNVNVYDGMLYSDYIKNTPPREAFEEAKTYKIGQYIAVPINIDLLKAHIVKYGMVVARFDIGEEWWKPDWNANNILPLRPPEQTVSGHAVIIHGYDDSLPHKTKFYISNSWSSEWADNGNGFFYFEDYYPHLTEAWAITLNPVPENGIASEIVLKLINIFRSIGTWTGTKLGIK